MTAHPEEPRGGGDRPPRPRLGRLLPGPRAWLALAVLVGPSLIWLALAGIAYPSLDVNQSGDYAKIELYTRLAAEGSQRVGAESRFHVHQPGPAFFYFAAPFYALLGGTTTGMALGALAWNAVALIFFLRSAHRLASEAGLFVAVILLFLFVEARGVGFLLSPWNPHVAMIPFGVTLLAGARLATGEGAALPLLALASIAVVQSQMAWSLPVLLVIAVSGVLCVWPDLRRWMGIHTRGRGLRLRDVGAALAVSAALWAVPVVDEFVGEYKNLHRIVAMTQRERAPRPWSATLALSVQGLNLRRDGLPPASARIWGWHDDTDPRWPAEEASRWATARGPVWAAVALGAVGLGWFLAARRGSATSALALITAVGVVSLPLAVRNMPGKAFPPYLVQWGAMVTLAALMVAGVETLVRAPRLQGWIRGRGGAALLLVLAGLLLADAVRNQAILAVERDPRDAAYDDVANALKEQVRVDLPEGRRFLLRVGRGSLQGTVIGLILALDKAGLPFAVEPFGSCRIEGHFTPRGDEEAELLVGNLRPVGPARRVGVVGGLDLVWDLPWRRSSPGSSGGGVAFTGARGEVKLITLDPGHFHAALVQKSMYPQVDPKVHVFAPAGPDVESHLARIEAYNARAENPTSWKEVVYTGDDFLEKMLAEKPGNVVVISGNNARKAEYIRQSVKAGLNVLADKPMAIRPADYEALKDAYRIAAQNGVLIDDIMTERFEITSILQKRLSRVPELFGELVPGSPENPAISKQSVHHFSKIVSGRPLVRPAWFFDVRQQGEGIVDVTTHLVDLIQWQAFPGEALDFGRDVEVLSARRWPTRLTLAQFARVTGLEEFPEFLKGDVGPDGVLEVYANGEIVYRVKGIHVRVSVEWRCEAPPGAGDTHYSIMRGSKARLLVRQGEAEDYQPTLYVEPAEGREPEGVESALRQAVSTLAHEYPGLGIATEPSGWSVIVPDEYRVGHEAHFAQVTKQFFRYLVEGRVPPEEVQNLLTKYAITTKAWEMSRP